MAANDRPLSPHLQVYRPQLTSVLSIAHRATGVFLAIGLLVLTYWLTSLAAGQEHFESATALVGSWFGRTLLLGFTFSLFYHLANGVRHLYWDIGRGFELPTVYRSGWLVVIFSTVATLVVWIVAYSSRG